MLHNFFTGFEIPSIFDYEGPVKRRNKFDKLLNKRQKFLIDWSDDFNLFKQPSPAEIKEAQLASLKREEKHLQEQQSVLEKYIKNLKQQEEKIHAKHEELQKKEIVQEEKPKKPSIIKKLFDSEDELDKLFNQFTKTEKKSEAQNNEEIQQQNQEEKKDQIEEEKNEPPKLEKEQSIARQVENTSKLEELKTKLQDQGFKCQENDPNDEKNWVVGKKKFINENNQKEKQVFYQIHDKNNPNCNYSGYQKQIRDDDGNFSTVKKSVYHFEKL